MGRRLIQNGRLGQFVDLNQVDLSDLQILIDAVLSNANLGSHSAPYQSSWLQNIAPLGWSNYDQFKFLLITLEDIPLATGTGRGWTSNDGRGNYALGFGYDPYQRRGTLYGDLVAAGVPLPNNPVLLSRLRNAGSLSQSGMNVLMRDLLTGRTISFGQAASLFSVIDDEYERNVDSLYSNLPPSIERAIVFDLRYQGYLLAGAGSGSAKDNYRHELYNLLDRGDFVGAAVHLALTDGNVVVNGNYARDVTRARVLLYSQMLTDPSGLLGPSLGVMGVLPALLGQPLNVPITDKALQASLDLAATLRARLGDIQAWEARVRASGDPQLINARNEFLGDALANSRRVLGAHGFHLNSGQSVSLGQAAGAAQVPAEHLQAIYGNRTFAPFEVFLVPHGTPREIGGDRTLAGLAPAADGQRRVVRFDHDSNNFVTFITKSAVGAPAVTFVNEANRTIAAVEYPAAVMGFEKFGNGYRIRLVDGDSFTVTSSSDSSGERIRAEYTHANGQVTVFENLDGPVVAGREGGLFLKGNYYRGQWAAGDFQNIPGLANPYLLAQILGRADAPEGMGGEGPPIALQDIVDPDGPVSYEVRINRDGTKEAVTIFYLNNSTTGVGDRLVQVTKQAVLDGQDVTVFSSVTRVGDDATVTYVREQAPSHESIGLVEPKVDITFEDKIITLEQFGSILGSNIGRFLAGRNVAKQIAFGAVLSTVSGNLGELADNLLNKVYGLDGVTPLSAATKIDEALGDIGTDFLQNLKSAGAGALSSFLLSEIFKAVGVSGLPGELGQAVGGAYLSAAIEALPELLAGTTNFGTVFKGIDPLSIAASWLGSTLASEIAEFDTIGGQLGSSIGSAVGAIAGSALAIKHLGTLGAAIAGPIGALVGAFVGFLAGGMIGSLVGGTPRSGADVQWDPSAGEFTVENAYARKGGSKEAATSISGVVASIYNSVLQATQSKLLAPETVQAGNYGMRHKDWVYRPISTQSKSAIEARFRTADELIAYGAAKGLKDIVANAAGGDVFVKRALFNTLDASDGAVDGRLGEALGAFRVDQIAGVVSVARDYSMFAENAKIIAAAIANDPHSNFALGWATTLAMAADLHLDRRGVTDWTGGYAVWLDELNDGRFDGVSVAAAAVDMNFNFISNGREWFISGGNGGYRGTLTDDIAIDMQTIVNGSDDAVVGDLIDLRAGTFGGANIEIAAVIFAKGGNDTVHASDRGDNVFGGDGNDTLYGGKLDDWLIGGEGNDILHAGSQSGGLGGDGNYLDGGDGDDQLHGREGSDWLEGGDGTDRLVGGAGGDILAGGAGDGDDLEGGSGDDIYLFRRGDGSDMAEDQSEAAPVRDAAKAGDAVTQRFAGIAAGSIKRDWLARSAGVSQGKIAGGEDSIHFGIGIELGDVQLAKAANGRDLIVRLSQVDPATGVESLTGDVLTVTDWFSDPFKRVEWLKFADGTEIRIGDVTSFIVGTSGADVLIGTGGKDFVYGGAGNDELHLLAGDDIGSGGTGDDMVSGGADHDLIVGGLGSDKLIGGSGNDALSGDAGADDLYGGKGDDVLSGGRDDGDVLAGGAGNDRFKYNRGDGHDIVIDDYSDHWATIWHNGQWVNGYQYNAATSEVTAPDGTYVRRNFGTAAAPDLRWVGRFDYDEQTRELKRFNPPAGAATTVSNKGVDTIEFALDINIQDIILTRPAGTDDIRLTVSRENAEGSAAGASDSVTLKDYYDLPGAIERVAFYQTGEIDISASGYRLVAGTDGADGTEAAALAGSAGRDWMSGGGGDDVLAGGAGDDIIVGNSGSDRLKGESGNDVLYGGAGNDVLDGGAGDDVLSGGAGSDTASYASAAGGVSAFLTEPQMNRGDALLDTYDSIENLLGGAGADTLGGDDGDNELTGGMGNDLLLGGRGNDTYVWNIGDGSDSIDDSAFTARQVIGSGGELLEGYHAEWTRGDYRSGSGSNARYYWKLVVTGPDGVVVFSHDRFAPKGDAPPMPAVKSWPADGWMAGLQSTGLAVGGIIYDRNVDAGEADAIELGAGISLSDLAFERDGDDLVISYVKVEDGNNGGGNAIGASKSSSLSVRGHFTVNGRIESLIFADGLSVSLESILTATTSNLLTGTTGADLMTGQRGVRIDRLDGGDGDDVLAGGEGDDVLSGSAGDDVLEGGAGADTLDGGASTPYDPAAAIGAGGRRGDEVRYSTSIAGVTIDLAGTAAQSGGDAQGDIIRNVENVTGSGHADIIRGDSEANRLRGLAGDDHIEGRDGDDVLIGDAGNDRLQGDSGEDNVSGGDGDDRLLGGSGRDLLAGDGGNDHLSGDDGDDTLSGDSGDDRLEGGLGNDSLVAGEGADLLLGGEGNDTLAGEAGNDDLQGGAGDDNYVFKAGFGNDLLTDAQGKNEILIDSSIAYDRLWLEQKGDDLLITVRGSSDTLTVKGFFGTTASSTIYSIQTATHRLFLHHPDTRNFIAAMTAASVGGIPGEIPAAVQALMPRYWHSGTTARPYAADIALAIDEDHDTGSVQVGAIDHDDNITGYELGDGPAHGTVAIDQNGAFRFTPTANFNGSDSFTLIISDSDNQAREIRVSVTVAAVDDAPVIDAATLAIDEQALRSATRTGDRVAALVAHELDGEAIVFSLTEDAGGRFVISADGKLDVRDADRLDHETGAAHGVTVRVTDAVGTFTERTFSVAIGDVNEENWLPAAYAWNVDENSAVGTIVGRVVADDLDKPDSAFGEQRYYFWHSDAAQELSSDGRYRIDALSGEITLAAIVDHEAPAPISQHQVIARDDRGAVGGHESSTTVTIAITDLNEANGIPASHSLSFAENEAAGLRIGAVAATDPDNPGTAFANQRYYFWDGQSVSNVSSDGRFTIDEVSGAVFANATFDYESDVRDATYQVVARDNRGDAPFHSAFTDLSVHLTNVNEAPETPILGYSANMLAEGAGAGTVVARFTLADPDRTVPTLVPESNPGGLFTIVGNELRLAANLDFEALVALGFTVADVDGDGRNDIRVSLDLHVSDGELRSSGSTGVSLVVEDVNEAPLRLDFAPSLSAIAERDRIAAGSPLPAVTIGEISVPDPDTAGFANASYSYSVDDPRFEIVGNLLRLREGVALDFEQAEQLSVTLTATDQSVDPFTITRTLNFAVADQDDILDGTQDSDLLEGQKGRDIIRGLAGDDELRGHAGADDLHGDDGADLILGGDGADRLDGGSDDDRLEGGAGDDSLAGGTGDDVLFGGAGADSIAGDAGDDIIIVDEDGLAVLDNIEGGGGTDTLTYRHFSSGIDADLAAALVAGDSVTGVENIEGTLYADHISGDGGANALSGLDGDDVLVGRGGDDLLVGGHGNDDLAGGAGDDRLVGGAGGDLLSGGGGSDVLLGGGDGDTLLGEAGDDYLEGGAGNDIADGGEGNDSYIIDRQSDHDTIFNFDATGADIDVLGFKDTYGIIEERDLWFERQGDDLLVTVIGADSSVLVKNWYLEIDPGSGANHRIDFFIAGERFSRDTDVEALVELMADYSRPADRAELDLLLADPDYEVRVATYFGINAPPVIDGIVDQRFGEGGSVLLTLGVSDDITPKAGITVTHKLLSGAGLFDQGALELGPVGSDGRFTLRLEPGVHSAGTAIVELTAEDAGGISVTRQIVLTVDPVATTPVVTQFIGGSGTSGGAGVALSLSVEFPDRDGSEVHEILIAGVPAQVSLSRGSFDGAAGLWRLTPDQLAGLTVLAPRGWSQDLSLTVTARASEGGTAADAVATTTIVLNAPPTDIRFTGAASENLPNGTALGLLDGIDPDTGERLSYILLDGADGRFALAPDGALSVADGSKLDHEADSAHTIRVRATDSFGEAIERDVIIPVANVNEANSMLSRYVLALDENLAGGTAVGQVQADDRDAPGHAFAEQRYFFRTAEGLGSTSADGLFAIDQSTGLITTTRMLDHETDHPGDYTVVALDNRGETGANEATTSVSISLRNLNETNGLEASINLSVLENQGVGTLVGTVRASDFDSPTHPFGEQRYYFLIDGALSETSADSRFTIDPVSGEVRTARMLDHESADASTAHVVVARDNRGVTPFHQVTASLGIAVANQNEAPDTPQGSSVAFLDEVGGGNPAVAGALVASYGLSDRDGPAPALVFATGGNPHGLFEISGGSVRFAGGVSLTFQAARDLAATLGINIGDADGDGRADVRIGTVAVRASDGEHVSGEKHTDVYIEDVAQAPGAPSVASQTFHRETLAGQSPHSGQVIATFNQSDSDGATPTLSIVGGNDQGWFTTVGSQLVFASNAPFTADWLRLNAAAYGMGSFSHDVDGDGLKEIRVASLSLVSRDNDGLQSTPVQYEVYIEDQPEAPGFVSASLSIRFDEGIAAYTRVGQVAGTDVDGPAEELRYGFEGASIAWNSTLARYVSGSSDGKLLMDHVTGEVFTAPGAVFDADSGPTNLSYGVRVIDRLGGQHSSASAGALNVAIGQVNEPHTLSASSGAIDEVEGLPPLVERFDLRSHMLTDPENQNMVWTFADGSSVNGIWTLTSDGKLCLTDGRVDYEQLITYTTTRFVNAWPEPYEEIIEHRDPSRATMALAVKARDPETGIERQATFTATVNDVNEGPIYTGTRTFIIQDDEGEGRFGNVFASDPEGRSGPIGFQIDPGSVTLEEVNLSRGDSADVDNTGNPTVSLIGNELRFSVPGDGEWEGGIRNHPVYGGRWYYQLNYSFDLVMTDPTGVQSRQRIMVKFLKHGTSHAAPVVFDLDGDGLELVSLLGSSIRVDMDGDGLVDTTGWVKADDGLLALDRDGSGAIDHVSEISFIGDIAGATSDLEGLRAYDSNADGMLDAADARFSEFRVWRDLNQDGASQAGELMGLIEAGVAAIDLTPTMTGDRTPSDDNVLFATASFARMGGGTGIVGDVFLAYERSDPPSVLELEESTGPAIVAPPVIFDYDGDGTSLVSLADSKTRFDMDGNGKADRTGWFEAGDAMLALDRNGDGAITDIAEISFVGDLPGAKTDLEGLRAFDGNGDDILDASDKRFAAFRLWFDRNSNGVSDAGELKSLAEAGVVAISLRSTTADGDGKQAGGNIIYGRAAFAYHDGRTGTLLDAGLAYLPDDDSSTTATAAWTGAATSSVPEAAAAKPAALQYAQRQFSRKSKKFTFASVDGQLVVSLRKSGSVDPRAGVVPGATIMRFSNETVGMLSPVILDLDGDGIEMRSRKDSRARFDMDGDGTRDDTGWHGKGDGFLVIDRNLDGIVNDGSELSFMTENPAARSDLDALASLDSNRDRMISSADKRFGELKLWIDANGNGITDPGELKSLADHGIASISLAGRTNDVQAKVGSNLLLATSTFTRTDGSVGTAGDAALAFRPGAAGSPRASAATGPASPSDDLRGKLEALQAGLDREGGLELGLARILRQAEASGPFVRYDEDRSRAATPAAQGEAAEAGSDLPEPLLAGNEGLAGAITDRRVAQMIQQMATFGARAGEADWRNRAHSAQERYDYFA